MPYDPSLGPWFPPAIPSAGLPKISPQVVTEYLESLKRPSPSISYSPPPESKSIVDRVRDATTLVRKAIAANKLTKGLQVQWAVRVRTAFKPLYGEKSALLATLNQWIKEMSKSQLAT